MKALKFLLAVAAGFSLGACTTPPRQATVQADDMNVADRYRSAVQAGAERRGVQVYWINPPDDEDLGGRDGG